MLGLHKPFPLTLAEGPRETVDEDEGHKEEESEPNRIKAAVCIVRLVVEVIS